MGLAAPANGDTLMAERSAIEWHLERFNAQLARLVQQMPAQADRVVFTVAQEVLSSIKRGWPVDTGVSRNAWIGPTKVAPAAYQLSNPYIYARVIEYGGYPGVGPKTERTGGETLPGGFDVNAGVYPVQVPHAPVRRALARHYGQIAQKLGEIVDGA